jgi:uncharacterized damage-inducible protein DinB
MDFSVPSALPLPEEVPDFFSGYVAKASRSANLFARLSEQACELQDLLDIPDLKRSYRYDHRKWSVHEVLGHLVDAERIFSYRALRIGRGDRTPLPGFDENDYVTAAGSAGVPFAELLEEFQTVRRATILLLRHLPDEAWTRMGVSSGKPISTRTLAFVIVGHVEHHMGILRERYGL